MMTECWCKMLSVERSLCTLDSELKMLVLSKAIVAPLEIFGHNAMLPVWPLIHIKKKNTQLPKLNTDAVYITYSYFVSV